MSEQDILIELKNMRQELKNIKDSLNEDKITRKSEIHSEQLRDMFVIWRDNLYKPPNIGFEIYDFPEEAEAKSGYVHLLYLQKDPLFLDAKNHFPPKFNDLPDKWEYYKNHLQEYSQKEKYIIGKIKELIQKDNFIPQFFPESVYLKAVELLTNKKYYDYKNQLVFHTEPKKYVLMYSRTSGTGYPLSKEYTKEEIIKVQEQHESISNDMKNKFEVDIKDLINMADTIRIEYDKFRIGLNELILYPVYYNMNCEYTSPKT